MQSPTIIDEAFPPSSWGATVRLNLMILRTCIEERLTYRGDFVFSTFVRFLPIVTQIFLWAAIYKTGQTGEHQQLNGYTYQEMVAYYLLAMVSRAFSSMPGLSSGIASDIREGTIKKYLTQPIDYLNYLFWYRVAHKLVYYLVAIFPFAVVFYLCGSYFTHQPSPLEWVMFFLTLFGSFFVGFLIESLLGLLAFWFLEVSSLIFIYMMFNYFLSGHMIPLDWLPAWLTDVIFYLPFKYLAYTPAAMLLGKYTPDQMWYELTIECCWILGLFVANRLAYKYGVERYSAYGG
jgi:ABC-2 type transport system permease protein